MKTTKTKKLLWLKFSVVQVVGFCLLLSVLTRGIFRSPLIVQIAFVGITLATLLANIVILSEMKKIEPVGEFRKSTVFRQLVFASGTFVASIFAFYQLFTTTDDFQRVTSFVGGIIFLVLSILLFWGIKYVIRLSE